MGSHPFYLRVRIKPKAMLVPFQRITASMILTLALVFASSSSGTAQGDEKERENSSQMEKGKGSPDIEVDDPELKKLVSLDQEMRSIQISSQKKLRKNIEESKIDRQRFGEIRRAQRNGDNPDMTEEEKKAIEKIEKKNQQVQKEMKEKMKNKVEKEGMEWKRYRKLRKAINQQPELRERYRKEMAKQQDAKKGRKGKPRKKGSPKGSEKED